MPPVPHGLNPLRSSGSTSARRAVSRVHTDETSALLLGVSILSRTAASVPPSLLF